MELKTRISTYSEWAEYQRELFKGFRKANISHKKFREARSIANRIDVRFAKIANEEVDYRRDHKEELHRNKIFKHLQEINELIDVLNENFVLEILLGD